MGSSRRDKVLGKYLHPSDFFKSDTRRQFQDKEGTAYEKLQPETVYLLLERSDKMHNAANLPNLISARQLLERMSNMQWTCTATAHEGGFGDAKRKPDPYLHFNINFEKKPTAYHVRCRELPQGGLLVFQVAF